ncbi:hypothetical protein BS47DRAFT_1384070 [Hydnum rufescens UP504]|uniref:Uncharacterized protein n=1 Tax=Hydnum rufescens UP504 TaxID=1448309 RepID=A0A9P6AQW8_9AGAM|nr:hypothetical protein BS47DRAFT_1384070 [Hydnum rufescens UP504]
MSPLHSESVAKPKKAPGSNNAKHKALIDSAMESHHEKAVKAFGQRKKGILTRAPNGEPEDVTLTDDAQDIEEETLITVHTFWETLDRQLSLGGEAVSVLIDSDESTKSKVHEVYTYICHKEHHTAEALAQSLEARSPPNLGLVTTWPITKTNPSHKSSQSPPNWSSQPQITPSASPIPIKPSMMKKVALPSPSPVNPTQCGHPGHLIVEFKPKLHSEAQAQGRFVREKINLALEIDKIPAWL